MASSLIYTYITLANISLALNGSNSSGGSVGTPTAIQDNNSTTSSLSRLQMQMDPLLNEVHQIVSDAGPLLAEASDVVKFPGQHLTAFGQKQLLQMPDPWPISDIKPKLVFYRQGRVDLEFDYDANPVEAAAKLLANGYLDSRRLVLITHGFHNNFDTDWMHTFKDLIFNTTAVNKFDHTVGILGWGGGADILVFRYRQAASNVMPVGLWLANYTKAIYALKPELDIYGIGHSLGAHVMGVAARTSKAFTRITGLDPAGPCFEKVKDSPTLYKTDARLVDVIHTDGYDSRLDPSEWFFPVNHYGSLVPIGTFDFYPNYGYHQPGAGTFTVAGSHLRSLELFAWSITNPGKFVTSDVLAATPDFDEPVDKAMPGQYPVEMGFYADRSTRPPTNASTLFYLKTNSATPWV